MVKKVIRRAKKAKKILTEFALKNNKTLRIYVYFWGDREYAESLGYYGNTIYKPVLIDKDGFEKEIYQGSKGLPSLEELKGLYDDWKKRLLSKSDRKRFKEVTKTLYELAEENTYFSPRQAHVVYHLLRIASGGPTFRITRSSDVQDLNIHIAPTLMLSFKGYKSFKQVTPYVFPTAFSKALKILKIYDNQIEKIALELKQELADIAGPKGPMINLDALADHVNKQIIEIFEKESQ